MKKSEDEEIVHFSKGDLLFSQGDSGGDLFFILKGKVQIFTYYEGKIVPLSEMGEGEVLGTLTCLTKKERLASARALNDLEVKRVRHSKIAGLMAKLPEWMKIVLKDFSFRLEKMNEAYSKTVNYVELLSINQVSYYYTSAQMAGAISASVNYLKKIVDDDTEALFPEDVVEFLEPVLLKSKEELEAILQIFIDSGMIGLKIEQEKKRKYFTVENATKIKDYAEFISQLKRKKIRKILDTRMANKEIRVLGGLVRYAEGSGKNLQSVIEFNVSELAENMEKKIGQKFDPDVLQQAADLGLIKIEGKDSEFKISFSPRELSHTLAHISAYKKLSTLNISHVQG